MMTFTAIPNEIMDMKMSDGAFRLYYILQSYCFGEKNESFPSQKTLVETLRKSVRTIKEHI